jgi:hypothetical protein
MTEISPDARRILERGTLCYLGAPSPAGPHVTPVVFVLDGGRLWGTTARGTTKAKLWRKDASAGGLVGSEDRWLSFRGSVELYDALDPFSWARSVRRARRITTASARFSLKNARFFAGYARDARRVPLSWTPPGRVVFSVGLDEGAILSDGDIIERWGEWEDGITRKSRGGSDLSDTSLSKSGGPLTSPSSGGGFATSVVSRGGAGAHPGLGQPGGAAPGESEQTLPDEVAALLREPGNAVLGLPGSRGPVVLPVRYGPGEGSYLVAVARAFAELAPVDGHDRAALVVDRASGWRAARMRGALARGALTRLRPTTAAPSLADVLPNAIPLRIDARTIVWWSGWSSGTVSAA